MNVPNPDRLSAIIPAAGFSSRMKEFKPLLPVGDRTMVEQVIHLFASKGIEDIVVVTGHNHLNLDPVVKQAGATPVLNPDFKSGMLSSIRQGVRHIRQDSAGFFLLPVDIPAIRLSSIDRLIEAYRRNRDQILIPYFDTIPGHPPLIPIRLKEDILNLPDGSTLRDLFSSQKNHTLTVTVYDRGTVMDADNKTGYEKILQKHLSLDIPDREECLVIVNDNLPHDPAIRNHLIDVSFTALKIAHAVLPVLPGINTNLVIAAGLLHDIKRKEKDHAAAGAKLLSDLGFPKVSEIIAQHMDIELDASAPVQEKEIVYFADKLCGGQGPDLNYHKRFAGCLQKSPWAMASISERYENTRLIQDRIESAAGKSTREILSE
jgi:putative nucleotidyltransferase with HDIG domain